MWIDSPDPNTEPNLNPYPNLGLFRGGGLRNHFISHGFVIVIRTTLPQSALLGRSIYPNTLLTHCLQNFLLLLFFFFCPQEQFQITTRPASAEILAAQACLIDSG